MVMNIGFGGSGRVPRNDATLANYIFPKIRKYVLNNAEQTPEMGLLPKTGHDGGDFIFVPQ